jgi:hypothetical protein
LQYLLSSHVLGCAWYSFGLPDRFGEDEWLPSVALSEMSAMETYLRVLYFGLATLSDRIESPYPSQLGPLCFMIATQVAGVLLLAYVIGNIGIAIESAGAAFLQFRTHLDYVQRFMSNAQLPKQLQERVRQYY